MKDINACEELIFKYTDALILTAYNEYKINNINLTEDKYSAETLLHDIVTKFVLPISPDICGSNSFTCKMCLKQYKRIQSLRSHIREHHKSYHQTRNDETTTDDYILNYSQNALILGYLVKSFVDARKYGDGDRIIRLYKYLMLYFKLDNRTKYAFQSLHLLAQINDLLPPILSHELKWNRTVNNVGRIDTNVELDRELEHRNKYAKADMSHFNGKVTDASIQRVSNSYDKIQKIINLVDGETAVTLPSGHHTNANWINDVKELSEQYINANIMRCQPGRCHSQFPSFPSNFLSNINPLQYKQWAQDRIMKFTKMNIYKLLNEFTKKY